ncbi:MAG: hypothetical protein P4L99_21840 [Chthoniobacter sp.]|nr:hypothetical protein [Chthoniobacter sp.]
MNIRRAHVSIEAKRIKLRLETGHSTTPIVQHLEMDTATALALSAQLGKAAGAMPDADLLTVAASHALAVALSAQPPLPEILPVEAPLSNQTKDQPTP